MDSVPVVLDACVLYPAYLRDTLLRCAEKGLFRIHWTHAILDEVKRNLEERFRKKGNHSPEIAEEKARNLINAMTLGFPDALIIGYENLIPLLQNHEKDRHVVAAAVLCEAKIIVTMNLKDFAPEHLTKHGIVSLHPDDFLCKYLEQHYFTLHQIIKEQAADMKNPPMTTENLLLALERIIPIFSNKI